MTEEEAVAGKDAPGETPRPTEGPTAGGTFRRELPAYATALAISLALTAWIFRLGQANLRVPLDSYWGDTLFYLALLKGTTENGWYLHNDSIGAPSGLDIHDFPLTETWHFAVCKLLGYAAGDGVVVYNLYYLLTFPVTTLSCLFVLCRLGISRSPAVVASVLYAFLPYHILRYGQLFLSSYYLVPPMALVILRLYLWQFPFGEPAEGDTPLSRRATRLGMTGALLVCVLTGLAQIYFAFFAIFLLLVAGLASAYARRKGAPLGMAARLITVTGFAVVVTVIPNFMYRAQHGTNGVALARLQGESDIFGLKITTLLLPQSGHRVPYLANLKEKYNQGLLWTYQVNENDNSCLGLVGSIGFLWLVGRLLLHRGVSKPPDLEDGLSVLSLSAFLLGTIGGLGSLFGFFFHFFLGGAWLRSYNRLIVYLAFFALAAAALRLDRLGQRYVPAKLPWGAFLAILAAVLLVGVLDQTSDSHIPPHADIRRTYEEEGAFVAGLESALPPGAMVFQLPYRSFPEAESDGMVADRDYDGVRFYLHSHTLRWSYGAMKGRDEARWQKETAALPAEKMITAVSAKGFRGILIDRLGFRDGAKLLEAELTRRLGEPRVGLDGRFLFFPLPEAPPGGAGGGQAVLKGPGDPGA